MIACLAMGMACGTEPCRVTMTDVDSGHWEKDATVVYDNTDTSTLFDLTIILHVKPDFEQRQLPLDIEILSPDSLRVRERLNLAVLDGHAAPSASYGRDVEIPYRQRIRLRREGAYTIRITPRQAISGVESAGVAFLPATL